MGLLDNGPSFTDNVYGFWITVHPLERLAAQEEYALSHLLRLYSAIGVVGLL